MGLPQSTRSALDALVRSLIGTDPEAIVEMPGGASTRQYFRIPRDGASWAVVMYVPDASQSDEIVKQDDEGERWPFVEVSELLQRCGVSVPRIYGESCRDGILLLEDLGDSTLANHLRAHECDRELLYQSAIRDLAKAQQAIEPELSHSVIGRRKFDAELLRWEVEHFREWALEARGINLDAGERQVFERAADYLAETIAGLPHGFVHRDYQSRNLMVRSVPGATNELVWIDYQDALLGPRVYDLVALLGDSYQSFSPEFIDARLDEYAAMFKLSAEERADLQAEFLIVMVQRKLKDAGRFVFLDRVKNKPEFLTFVEPTVAKALHALTAHGELVGAQALRELEVMLRGRLHRGHCG